MACASTNRLVGIVVGGFHLWGGPVFARQRPVSGAPEGTQSLRDLPYAVDGHERQKLDRYLPAEFDQPVPVVVYVHGGAWLAGSNEAQNQDHTN